MRVGIVAENLVEWLALRTSNVPEPLFETQMAFTMARCIMSGAALGVYETAEHGPRAAEEVAAACGTHLSATEKLLGALTGCGYFTYQNGRYALTPKSRKWMLRSSPGNLVDKMIFQLAEWDTVGGFETFVRDGKPIDWHDSTTDEEFWNVYQRAMRSLSSLSAAEVASRFPVPHGASRMLDIGGSHGFYSVSLCRKQPDLKSVILDLPDAVKQSAVILAEEQMGDRVTHRPGNALTDDLGEKTVDIVFVAQLIHHFSDQQNRDLMQRIARALRPDGVCVVLDFILPETPGSAGQAAALFDLYFAVTSESGTWPLDTIRGWYATAGLQPQKFIWLRTMPNAALVIGKKAG